MGLDRHTTGAGQIIWHGGGRLAADLTLPRLRARWTGIPAPPPGPSTAARLGATGAISPQVYQRAADYAAQAATALRAASSSRGTAAIGYAAADLLAATARAREGRAGGPLTDAAEVLDRAARYRLPMALRARCLGRRS